MSEIEANLRQLLDDYITNEGQGCNDWKNVKADQVKFDHVYDLTSLSEILTEIKLEGITKRAGLSPVLVGHYLRGTEFPSLGQVQKLQNTIQKLWGELEKAFLT